MTESTDETEQQPPGAVSDHENEQIREQRLDPDNRPDSAEVDNTRRTFDGAAGMFTDNPDYDEAGRPYAGAEESAEDSGEQGEGDDDGGPKHRE